MRNGLGIVGLLLSLTLSGAALAQQGGGGRGGDGGSGGAGDSGSRDDSVLAIRRQDAQRLDLSGPVTVKAVQTSCRIGCSEVPQRTVGPIIITGDGCSEQVMVDGRQRRTIRRICRTN